MALTDLLSLDAIALNLDSHNKQDVLNELVTLLSCAGKLQDPPAFLNAVMAREATGSTGLEQGIAMPHARSDSVHMPALAFGISREGIDFGALDGQPSHIFLMVAEPEEADSDHLEVLAAASCHLIDPAFRERLLQAGSAQEVVQAFAEAKGVAAPPSPQERLSRIVAVTSCPAGIAHTYIAAKRLTEAARDLNIDLLVETHGAGGVRNTLTLQDIQQADAVIVAAGRNIGLQRFAGKPMLQVPVTEAIRRPQGVLSRALSLAQAPPSSSTAQTPIETAFRHTAVRSLYRHMMTGVSSMLPFVVGSGVLLSLSFLLSTGTPSPSEQSFIELLQVLGGHQGALGLMVPVLAAFIGHSIADRPGLMPAMVGGLLAVHTGSGFLGGLLAGFLGGYLVMSLKYLCHFLPDDLDAIRTTLIYPVGGLLLCGSLIYGFADPLAFLNNSLVHWLDGLDSTSRIVLGAFLAALMAVDLGGPVNKAAYTFSLAAIEAGNYLPLAAVMAGGMVPPLGVAMATLLFPSIFTASEHKARRSSFIMGASFITEGAIPYAVADPRRVLPACILGSMLAGTLSMAFGCELLVPHGGVFVIPLVHNWPGYLLAILSGTLLTSILVGLLKRYARRS